MSKAKKGPARKVSKKDKAAQAVQRAQARAADGYPRTSRRPADREPMYGDSGDRF